MKIFRTLVVVFLLSLGGTMLFLETGGENEDARVRIEVASGESVQEIAQSLKKKDLIISTAFFRFYLHWRELDRLIKPGVYLLPKSASYSEMANVLAGGEGEEMAVTIPEGFTITQIDDLLMRMDLIAADDFRRCALELAPPLDSPSDRGRAGARGELRKDEVECDFSAFTFLPSAVTAMPQGRLEGYLFPDTYFVSVAEFSSQKFLERLLRTFEERVVTGLRDDLAVSGRPLHEVMTMASLIERETRTDEERPMVSGILWKRFDAGIALDVDATIRYILEKPTSALIRSDLEFDSPYNSRRHAGLPPGPIANSGLASIKAALHPEDSSYWYYLHDNQGGIHYAETNEEHNLNKARYL